MGVHKEKDHIIETGGMADNASLAVSPVEHTDLKRSISNRQFTFMALGGSIGAGLLIASAKGLQKGGPLGLFFAFLVVGLLVYLTMCALSELSATFPVQGSFYDYSVRFISPSWGFSMGWNYVINFILVVPFEITVMILICKYWNNDLPGVAVVPAFIAVLFFIQAFGAKWYAEAEHGFGLLKVGILVIFTITGIVIAAGGKKSEGGQGISNWADNSAFLNGGLGFLSVFVSAGMAYGGTEMLGLAVAEAKNPRTIMPLACKIVIGRIIICYLLPLFVVGLVVKPTDFSRPEFASLHAVSPFVVATKLAKIPILPDIINAVLLVSVFSMANASIFASSRSLTAIAKQGMGPHIFSKTTASGLPLYSIVAVFVVSNLSWITAAPEGADIFDWLLALASASNFFTWMSICVCHIRLRKAMARQGRSPNELVWKSPYGIWGSYVAVGLTVFSLVGMVVVSAMPSVLETELSRIEQFFQGMLGYFVVFFCWFGHFVYSLIRGEGTSLRQKVLIPLDEISLGELDSYANETVTEIIKV